MKSWIKRSLFGLFGATFLLGGLAACSRGHHGMGWHGGTPAEQAEARARMLDKAARHLSLDDAQRAKLSLVAERLADQRSALMGAANPRDELKALIAGTQFDRSKASALVQGKAAAVQDKSPALITALGDFYDSLKPEQQQQLRELLDRGGRHGWRR
jgi:Spy/CpxP family protein refolding chaperone